MGEADVRAEGRRNSPTAGGDRVRGRSEVAAVGEAVQVEPTISGTVAEHTPTRGRPRRYHRDHIAFVQRGTGLTPRASQEKIHMGRAHGVLLPVLTQYPELTWLLSTPDAPYRVTILSALGRIRNHAALIVVAQEVAQHQLKSRAAVAYIRRARRILEDRPVPRASVRALANALLSTLDDYARRFPDVTHDQERAALTRAWLALTPEESGAGQRDDLEPAGPMVTSDPFVAPGASPALERGTEGVLVE